MSKIVTIHSFKRGTGKSTVAANVAALLAANGRRVGLVDTNFESPSLYHFLKLTQDQIIHSLNDYLWGECNIEETVQDVTPQLNISGNGRLFFVSASPNETDRSRMRKGGFFINLLGDGLHELLHKLNLDILLIDTLAGINEETLFFIAIANIVVAVLHTDQQDFQGTAIVLDVAEKLTVPRLHLVANQVSPIYDANDVVTKLQESYNCETVNIILHEDKIMAAASDGIFVQKYPDHSAVASFNAIAANF